MMKGKRIYIFGMPRTGTTVILDVLSKHYNTIVFDEDVKNYPNSEKVEKLINNGINVALKMPGRYHELDEVYEKFSGEGVYFIILFKTLPDLVSSFKRYKNKYHINLLGIDVGTEEGMQKIEREYNRYMDLLCSKYFNKDCFVVTLRDYKFDKHYLFSKLFNFLGLEYMDNIKTFVEHFIFTGLDLETQDKMYPGNARTLEHG
jgi:hypothetical protein